MRAAPAQIRFAWAMLALVLLALRCLAPAGFMPAFDDGAVAIVACPDSGGAAPSRMHHAGEHTSLHEPCPYASAASLGALGPDWKPLLAVPVFAVALLLGRTFLFIERHATRERPPSRGPPIPV